MMSSIEEQTRNAFEFIDKLYLETSYLIKEVEGQLQEMQELFVILRPSGYGVSTVASTGLEAKNVDAWLRKRLAVAFVPERTTELRAGQTITPFSVDLRVLFLTIVLNDRDLKEPMVFFGFVDRIRNKNKTYKKFENILWEFPTSTFKMFGSGPKITFEDGYSAMSGEFKKLKLFSLKTNEDVRSKLVEPMVRLYRK